MRIRPAGEMDPFTEGGAARMNPTEQKRALRREMRALRAALPADYVTSAGRRMQDRVLSLPAWQRANRVFIYVSVGKEPDTALLLRSALAEGKRLYVPKCLGEGRMLAARTDSAEALRPGALGIPEPALIRETAEAADLDLIIVPCLSASADGRRLGQGGGYYDRFLAGNADRAICLCYARLLRTDIPAEATDVWIPTVITEAGDEPSFRRAVR